MIMALDIPPQQATMKIHNIISWGIISAMLSAYEQAHFDDLSAAVSQHKHRGNFQLKDRQKNGASFIRYCIKMRWLKEVSDD